MYINNISINVKQSNRSRYDARCTTEQAQVRGTMRAKGETTKPLR